MGKMLLVLILIVTCAITIEADENNLAGGVLIAHYVPYIAVRYQTFCEEYYNCCAISDASEQTVQTYDVSTLQEPTTWFVLAAFHEDKTWCGTQFGLGDYNPMVFYLTEPGQSCLLNCLTIPTADWPGPGEGISIAATDVVYEGNYVPVYSFRGYTYYASIGDDTPTLIEITEHPTDGFIGFGNCLSPAQLWSAEGGAIGFFMNGIAVYPTTPGACCFDDGSCLLVLEAECLASGGDWLGEGTDCNPNPCPVSATVDPSWGRIKTLYR
jgi:hypothetical protein